MIEAVKKIGEYVQGTAVGDDLISTFIENPNSNGKYKFVLIVILSEKNGEYVFNRVDFEEFNNYQKYLYKKGAPNGTDATPTSKIAGSLEKTYRNRFLKWFQNYDSYDVSHEDKEILRRMYLAIDSEASKILVDLEEKFSLKGTNNNAIITLGIEIEGELQFPGNISIINNILLRKGKDKYYHKKSQGTSLGKDAMCSVCKKKKDEVYGFAIPWAFHTFDKPGFVAGGFDVSESWKNTPVCFECATSLEMGKKYVEEKLDFGFYGFRYLLVPKLALGGDYEEVLSILEADTSKSELKINREFKNRITSDEREILDLVKDQKDFFSNSLIFYKKEQSSYRILLLIEGILPSRLKALFGAKEKVDERFKIYTDTVLSEAQRKKINLVFNFGVLRRFFPRESQNRTFDKIFLEIVDKIFVGSKIDHNLLMDFIMRRVRAAFIEGYPTNADTLNGFLLLHYINDLDLFRRIGAEETNMNNQRCGVLHMDDLEGLPLEQKIERFFEANEEFFNSDAKKATFLEGVLVQKLLNLQWMIKSATPFRAKLRGLNMNEALIKRLLPEIQNKLDEYGKNHYYRDLEQIIAKYFVLSGVRWEEVDDELSFYFVLGMDMHKLFTSTKDEVGITEVEA